MVVKRQCSFCAREIEPGTGMMFVRRDGTVFHFCTSSCRKQQLHLHRVGHRFKWTRAHELKRAADHATAQKAPATPSAPRPGRVRAAPRSEAETPSAPPAASTEAPPESKAPEAAEAKAEPAEAPAKKPRRPRKKAETPAAE